MHSVDETLNFEFCAISLAALYTLVQCWVAVGSTVSQLAALLYDSLLHSAAKHLGDVVIFSPFVTVVLTSNEVIRL